MTTKKKYRLIGLLVLVALLIIVVSIFLSNNGSKMGSAPINVAIPSPPTVINTTENGVKIKTTTIQLAGDSAKKDFQVQAIAPNTKTAASIEKQGATKSSKSSDKKAQSVPSTKKATATVGKTTPNSALSHSSKAKSALILWSVQLASFSNERYAKLLNKELQHIGYRSYLKEATDSNNKKTTQVYVGPVETRERAEDLIDQLNKSVRLRGIPVEIHPSKR